jgi:hypothetical protein
MGWEEAGTFKFAKHVTQQIRITAAVSQVTSQPLRQLEWEQAGE